MGGFLFSPSSLTFLVENFLFTPIIKYSCVFSSEGYAVKEQAPSKQFCRNGQYILDIDSILTVFTFLCIPVFNWPQRHLLASDLGTYHAIAVKTKLHLVLSCPHVYMMIYIHIKFYL